jgi:hypothetical protein
MTSSEDRWVYPAEGEDPRDIDAERTAKDAPDRDADRQVSHDQDAERDQGLSSDKPGVDVSEREVAAEDDRDERDIGEPGTS